MYRYSACLEASPKISNDLFLARSQGLYSIFILLGFPAVFDTWSCPVLKSCPPLTFVSVFSWFPSYCSSHSFSRFCTKLFTFLHLFFFHKLDTKTHLWYPLLAFLYLLHASDIKLCSLAYYLNIFSEWFAASLRLLRPGWNSRNLLWDFSLFPAFLGCKPAQLGL